ncbi:MAG: hypothetical protein O2884_09410 [Chloroflexi bacterium]|nr:hypothetical protein [Chloroflexota bacterium]
MSFVRDAPGFDGVGVHDADDDDEDDGHEAHASRTRRKRSRPRVVRIRLTNSGTETLASFLASLADTAEYLRTTPLDGPYIEAELPWVRAMLKTLNAR